MTHPSLEGVKCVVFDVDDTLYLERDYAKSGFHAVGRWASDQFGINDFATRAWTKFEADVRRTIFNEVLDEVGLDYDIELIREMVHVYRHHEPDIEVLPDAARCLDALADDFHLAALTGGPLACQKAKVRALDLNGRLDPIVFARQWGVDFDKPHLRSFEKLESLTGLSANELVYLADNPHKDFVGPNELGWHTVRVRREGSLHAEIPCEPGAVTAECVDLSEFI